MCGICGIIRKDNKDVQKNQLKIMTDVLKHRGPDGEGIWSDGRVGLGHRRLSIIDLTQNANQPMHSADNNIHIVFNGEIYNYKELQKTIISKHINLKSNSDTEVIIYLYSLYGESSFSMLRGMFAFALWDSLKKKLFLVRDRLGIKPLYIYSDDEKIIFASEIKAIASVVTELTFNKTSFFKFLRTAAFIDFETVFSEIISLEPGTYMKIDNGLSSFIKYWDLIEYYKRDRIQIDEKSTIDEYKEILESTMQYHLVSDVPIGSFLSGGLDSSLVSAIMSKINDKTLNTFSVIFPEQDETYDEGKYSKSVADLLKTSHFRIKIEEDFLSNIVDLAWYCDEPFGIVASYAIYFLSKFAKNYNKVVLTGDGADELLAGYQGYQTSLYNPYYKIRKLLNFSSNILKRLGNIKRNDQINVSILKLLRKCGNESFMFSQTVGNSSELNYSILDEDFIFDAWNSWYHNKIAFYFDELLNENDLHKRLYSSMKTRLVYEMLTKTDRMTMANSVEARVPFLDHVWVENCIPLSDNFKYNSTLKEGKYILKKISEKYLPKEIIYREKHPFDFPINLYVSRLINDKDKLGKITDGVLISSKILNRKSLLKAVNLFKNNNNSNGQFLLDIYIFQEWYESYRERIPNLNIHFN